MPKHRERNSDEFYKAQIRELKKEIRQLRQQLRQYEKYQEPISQDDDDIIKDNEDTHFKFCGTCGKGKLKEIDIVGRIFEVCDVCGDRKKKNG